MPIQVVKIQEVSLVSERIPDPSLKLFVPLSLFKRVLFPHPVVPTILEKDLVFVLKREKLPVF